MSGRCSPSVRHEHFRQVLGNQLTYLYGCMLGVPLHLLGRGLPDGTRPVGLLSVEHPKGGLRQMARRWPKAAELLA